ncbi:methyltransferase domain-containing protein [Arenibaculum pallidiluteum]|uniref:methyltransferase domain-containing protein n=1 Tax=Arenibaculum pallidiluteum TaxID=2812559 RepID=UPI001A9699D5|nr:methyltransferase domain-containing protein [Arenibaculum pallidiluteum]
MGPLDLSRRAHTPELMDTQAVDYAAFRRCLRHLSALNLTTFAYHPTLAWLDRLAERRSAAGQHAPLHIVDAGCGYGDGLRRIAAWARRRGVAVHLTGVDLNPWSARAAAEATPPGMGIRWETADIFAFRPDRPIDVVVSALFAHHLDEARLPRFLRWMEETARAGWFVNDLHRHAVPLAFTRAVGLLPGIDPMVAHDGPVSVTRAFTRADWAAVLAEAGIPPDAVTVRWFLFRWGVGRLR